MQIRVWKSASAHSDKNPPACGGETVGDPYGMSVGRRTKTQYGATMSFAKRAFWSQKGRKVGDDEAIAPQRRVAAKFAGAWSVLARAKKSGDKDRIIRAADECISFCSSEQRLEHRPFGNTEIRHWA